MDHEYERPEALSVLLEPCLPLFIIYQDQDEAEALDSSHSAVQDCLEVPSQTRPQVTKIGSFTCSFCGLAQPSHNVLNEHYLDHIEEDCKYCPYCCFSCLAPRTLKKHLREHAAHNQMCHRHCHYADIHDPTGEYYLNGEASDDDDKDISVNLSSNDVSEDQYHRRNGRGNRNKQSKNVRPSFGQLLTPIDAYKKLFDSSSGKNSSTSLQLPASQKDQTNFQQVSEMLKSTLLANGTTINGLSTAAYLQKLLSVKNESQVPCNGLKTDSEVGSFSTQNTDRLLSSSSVSITSVNSPSNHMDYSNFISSSSDSIAAKITSFFQHEEGSADGDFIEDMEDGNTTYSCTLCSYTCSHRSELTRHLTSHSESFQVHGKSYLRCPQCPFCSSSKSNLHRHIATHSRKLGSQSSEVNINWDVLSQTSGDLHYSHKNFSCKKAQFESLPPTLPTTLNGKTLLFCTTCDYTSYYKSNLNRHMARHGNNETSLEAGESHDSNSPTESPPNSPKSPIGLPDSTTLLPFKDSISIKRVTNPKNEDINAMKRASNNKAGEVNGAKQVLNCKACEYTTHNLSNFRRHALIHSRSSSLWHCCLCTYSSFEKSNVKRHIRMKHRQSGEGMADLDSLCYMKKDKNSQALNGSLQFPMDIAYHSTIDSEGVMDSDHHLMESISNAFPSLPYKSEGILTSKATNDKKPKCSNDSMEILSSNEEEMDTTDGKDVDLSMNVDEKINSSIVVPSWTLLNKKTNQETLHKSINKSIFHGKIAGNAEKSSIPMELFSFQVESGHENVSSRPKNHSARPINHSSSPINVSPSPINHSSSAENVSSSPKDTSASPLNSPSPVNLSSSPQDKPSSPVNSVAEDLPSTTPIKSGVLV